MAERLPITDIEKFIDGLDQAGVVQALTDITGWTAREHTNEPGIKAEAQAWLDRLNSRPDLLESARAWLRKTAQNAQLFLNDRVWWFTDLDW